MNVITEYAFYFFIYGFIGWVLESTVVSVSTKKLTNRGFLRGPIIPIYGVGALLLLVLLTPIINAGDVILVWNFFEDDATIQITDTFWIAIIVGTVAADIVEFVTGYGMEKLFHARWWDYSDRFLNIKGYICLKNTIYWALFSFGFPYIIHPIMYKIFFSYVFEYPLYVGIADLVFLAIFLLDLAYAVIGAKHLGNMIDLLTDAAGNARMIGSTAVTSLTLKMKSKLADLGQTAEEKYKNRTQNLSQYIIQLQEHLPNKSHLLYTRKGTPKAVSYVRRYIENQEPLRDKLASAIVKLEDKVDELKNKDENIS